MATVNRYSKLKLAMENGRHAFPDVVIKSSDLDLFNGETDLKSSDLTHEKLKEINMGSLEEQFRVFVFACELVLVRMSNSIIGIWDPSGAAKHFEFGPDDNAASALELVYVGILPLVGEQQPLTNLIQ
jgi:hypothetical protein